MKIAALWLGMIGLVVVLACGTAWALYTRRYGLVFAGVLVLVGLWLLGQFLFGRIAK